MEDGCIFLSPVTKTLMRFKKHVSKYGMSPQADVSFKEIVFMVKKYHFYHKKSLII